jgi:protein N-terminal amidase
MSLPCQPFSNKVSSPYKFQAPFHAFEFAFHVLHAECNLVVLTMAWKTGEDARLFSRTPNEPDMDVLGYWVARLEPLIRAESDEEIIIVICNRSGVEDDAVYAGSSAILGVQSGEVKVYGLLGRGDKKLLVVDTDQAPYAKLQHRALPSDSESTTPRSSSRQSSGSKQPSESSHHRAATPSSPAVGRESKPREYSPYTSRPTSPRQDSVSSTKSQDSRAYSSASSTKGKEQRVYSPVSSSREKDQRSYTPVSSKRDKDPTSYSPGPSRKEKESKPSSPRKPTPNPGAKPDLGVYTSLDEVVRSSLEDKEPGSPSSINSNNYLDPNERDSLRQDTPVVRFPDKTSSDPFSRKQIYGGQVSISYVEEGRSPVTPYDENRRAYWSNYKVPAAASMKPQGHRIRGTTGSKGNTPDPDQRTVRGSPRPNKQHHHVRSESQPGGSRDADDRRTGRPLEKVVSADPPYTYTPPPPVDRPSSPKSRNASRSRTDDASAASEPVRRNISTPNRADTASAKPEMALRLKGQQQRPGSRSREAIPIVASPSLFGRFDPEEPETAAAAAAEAAPPTADASTSSSSSRRREMSPSYRHSVSLCDGLALEMLPGTAAGGGGRSTVMGHLERVGGSITARGSNATPKLGGGSATPDPYGRGKARKPTPRPQAGDAEGAAEDDGDTVKGSAST